MTATSPVARIDVPSATADPAAYVSRLLDLAGESDALTVLATTPVHARALCADTPVALLQRRPEPDEWPAAQIVGHLYDVDVVYGFRWRLVVTEDDPEYPGYDEASWAPLARLPLPQSIDAWTGLRASNVALLRSLPVEAMLRTGRHGEQGRETMDVMLRKVIGHDIGHLNQLYRAVRAVRTLERLSVDALDATYAELAPGASASP